jgi:aspartyl-tRNA(Asn)/glutamyl-tRNA(Gln) amidotransferase subunit A
MEHSIEDVAILFRVISGHDDRDSSSYPVNKTNHSMESGENKGIKTIGIPTEYFGEGFGCPWLEQFGLYRFQTCICPT